MPFICSLSSNKTSYKLSQIIFVYRELLNKIEIEQYLEDCNVGRAIMIKKINAKYSCIP